MLDMSEETAGRTTESTAHTGLAARRIQARFMVCRTPTTLERVIEDLRMKVRPLISSTFCFKRLMPSQGQCRRLRKRWEDAESDHNHSGAGFGDRRAPVGSATPGGIDLRTPARSLPPAPDGCDATRQVLMARRPVSDPFCGAGMLHSVMAKRRPRTTVAVILFATLGTCAAQANDAV